MSQNRELSEIVFDGSSGVMGIQSLTDPDAIIDAVALKMLMSQGVGYFATDEALFILYPDGAEDICVDSIYDAFLQSDDLALVRVKVPYKGMRYVVCASNQVDLIREGKLPYGTGEKAVVLTGRDIWTFMTKIDVPPISLT